MDKTLANLVGQMLGHAGYEMRTAADLDSCRELLVAWRPDLACVDLDLHKDCAPLFGSRPEGAVPLIVFTRTADLSKRLDALTRGADDLVIIPFVLGDILARSSALMRRVHGHTVPLMRSIRFQSLEIDLVADRTRVVGGKEFALTPTQKMLLYLLAANAGDVVSRAELMSSIWDAAVKVESNVIDRHISALRVKLGDASRMSQFIETIPGLGYRFKLQA